MSANTTTRLNYWERISPYVSLSFMVLLAIASAWLVKNAPKSDNMLPQTPVKHEPDYVMRSFMLRRFDVSGQVRAVLEGREGRHYPDTDTIEVDDIEWHSIGPQGQVTKAHAKQGWSNALVSELRLEGNAKIEREASPDHSAITFLGQSLLIERFAKRVKSDQLVIIEQSHLRVEAQNMDYDHTSQVANTVGKISIVFASKDRT